MTNPIPTITIIGAGNMGSCLAGGLIANGHPADKLWISNPSTEKLSRLHKQFGIQTTTNNLEAVQHANIVVFAVKPAVFLTVAKECADLIHKKNPLILSIVTGTRDASIRDWLGQTTPVVRCMPNIPALIGVGATGLFANECVNEIQHSAAESVMRSLGLTVWLSEESQLDIITGLSGSGPAYFFLIMEALQEAGEKLGLTPETANLLTLQTALGAARMAIESGESLCILRQRVSPPGGTTERAIEVLEAADLRKTILNTVRAAKNRAEELANLL